MFLHFGLSTYKNDELSWGVCKTRKLPDRGAAPYPTDEWTAWKDEFRLPEFDALWWGGMFDADMWDSERLTRMIRELQLGILINNRANLPGDFDTPEHRIGMFQNHRPWESGMTICETWSYSKTPTKSPEKLVEMLVGTLCGDGNMLLSWGPKWSGAFAGDQAEALKSVSDWVKKNQGAIYGGEAIPYHQEGGRLKIIIPSKMTDPLCTVIARIVCVSSITTTAP